MQAKMTVENPDNVVITIKLSMTVKEWSELSEQLQGKWPSSRLAQHISSALSQIKRTVYSEDKELN